MRVVAYDPFLSPERALDLGVEKVDLDTLPGPRRLHLPAHAADRPDPQHPLRDNLMKTRPGVRLVNCARGGLVDEQAVADLIRDGHIAGAAFDVFTVEPAKESPLFDRGGGDPASRRFHQRGAGERGAAGGRADQRLSHHRRDRERLEHALGDGRGGAAAAAPHEARRAAGLVRGPAHRDRAGAVTISYAGHAASLNTRPLTQVVLTGLLRPLLASVNMVNAPAIAKQRNIDVRVITSETIHDYQTLLTVEVVTERGPRGERHAVPGPGAAAGLDRGIPVEAKLGPHMLYVRNQDKPGLIGGLGRTWATRGSTSRRSISAATARAATPLPWSRSTARSRTQSSPRSARCRVLHAKQLSF